MNAINWLVYNFLLIVIGLLVVKKKKKKNKIDRS